MRLFEESESEAAKLVIYTLARTAARSLLHEGAWSMIVLKLFGGILSMNLRRRLLRSVDVSGPEGKTLTYHKVHELL